MNHLGPAVYSINKSLNPAIETRILNLWSILRDYDKLNFAWKVAFVTQVDDMILSYLREVQAQVTPQ